MLLKQLNKSHDGHVLLMKYQTYKYWIQYDCIILKKLKNKKKTQHDTKNNINTIEKYEYIKIILIK